MKRNQIEILELQSKITEMKNSLEGLKSIFELAEKGIRRQVNLNRPVGERERMNKKKILGDPWDTIKCTKIYMMEVSEEERQREKTGAEGTFKDIIAKTSHIR